MANATRADEARKLHEKLATYHARMGEVLDQLLAVIDREPTAGENAKRLLDFFCQHWRKKYTGGNYVVNGPKDIAIFKRILKQLPLDEVAARIRRYFALSEGFVSDAKHSLPVFGATINKLSDGAAPIVVVGCRHAPPCLSEIAHTKRDQEEARHGR